MKSFSRTGPIKLSTVDVPAPLPDKEHTVLTKEEQKRNMLKNRRGSILLRFPFFLYNVGGHMHLETQVGALANQLNVCLLANVSIISHSYLKNLRTYDWCVI